MPDFSISLALFTLAGLALFAAGLIAIAHFRGR
jgi:hypothetical protein